MSVRDCAGFHLSRHEAGLVAVAVEELARRKRLRSWLASDYRRLQERCVRFVGETDVGVSVPAGQSAVDNLCTVQTAARLLGCSSQAVIKAISAGRLPAWRPGREWLLDVREVRQQAERRRDGRHEPRQ